MWAAQMIEEPGLIDESNSVVDAEKGRGDHDERRRKNIKNLVVGNKAAPMVNHGTIRVMVAVPAFENARRSRPSQRGNRF